MVFFCIEEIQECRSRVASVNAAGRRWSEADGRMRRLFPKSYETAEIRRIQDRVEGMVTEPVAITLPNLRLGAKASQLSQSVNAGRSSRLRFPKNGNDNCE
jgi:hypothetical protein